MKSLATTTGLVIALMLALVTLAGLAAQPQDAPAGAAPPVRFAFIDVFIDSADRPLGAYQAEIKSDAAAVKIVGIEGGEPTAFAKPPYYDPEAMQHERIIIAAFSTDDAAALPTGKVRIARIHVMIEGDAKPHFQSTLQASASADGEKIDATLTLVEGERK